MKTLILFFFTYLGETLILSCYCSNLFNSKRSQKTKYIFIGIGYIFLFLISLVQLVWLNTIFFILVNFLLLFGLYDLKCSTCLFHSMILTCIMGLTEIIVSGFFSDFSEHFLYDSNNFLFLSIITILSKLLYFIVLTIIMPLFPGTIKKSVYSSKSTILLNLVPFISFCIIIMNFAIFLNSNIESKFRYMLSFCALLLLLINIIIFYVYYDTQKKNKNYTELQLQFQKEYDMVEYYKTLFNQNENQQILIHDIRKHLMTISQLNNQHDYDKVNRYLDTLLTSSDLQTNIHVSDNELLNYILCHYIQICQKEHITFKIDVRKKILQKLDYSDLTALFCNLLDNAVASCSNIPDSYIELSITNKENINLTLISIINSCRTAPLFNKKGFPITTKKNKAKHGYGLRSIERIVNKHNGNIKMYFDNDKMTFHTIITIK